MPPRILAITGPTATGKTRLGVECAIALGGEVVSADSMQIYRRMDIGTAKPSAEETRGVPHHMIDVADPGENWSVARWTAAADKCCKDILGRGKVPVVVGGTGLYIDSLIAGRSFADGMKDEACRKELNERYGEIGGEAMLRELAQFDPQRAAKLSPADRKRIVRAWEVWLLSGETITEHDRLSRSRPPEYDAAVIALDYEDRNILYSRIDERADLMMEAGLAGEVRELLDSGLTESCTAMQAIGYKEIASALKGECGMDEAVELLKRRSRRYAKRQLTWLRAKSGISWIRWKAAPDFGSALKSASELFKNG